MSFVRTIKIFFLSALWLNNVSGSLIHSVEEITLEYHLSFFHSNENEHESIDATPHQHTHRHNETEQEHSHHHAHGSHHHVEILLSTVLIFDHLIFQYESEEGFSLKNHLSKPHPLLIDRPPIAA